MMIVKELEGLLTQFRGRPFELKKKKKKMMNNPGFYKFPRFTVAVYFTYFESIIVYRSTRRACSLLKHMRSGVLSRYFC